ncbi:MAG TPA: PepSY-associated TM helix domain-containing protein [Steroidobacteraceae bacterium]|nr:PepSY-associated TM helix domain-containing protein [Steroidobacteraceae bacterium]
MRKLHRWLMSVVAVLLLYWACSGLTLAIFDATDASQGWNDGGGPGARPLGRTGDIALPARGMGERLAAIASAARALAPDAPLTSIELRSEPDGLRGVVAIGGASPRTLTFDPDGPRLLGSSSAVASLANPPARNVPGSGQAIHNAIKSWHRGNVVGTWGVAVAIFTGLCALVLALSGVWMYFSLWRRRARAGRRAFFWS